MTERRISRRRLLLGTAAVAGGGLVLSLATEDADERRLAPGKDTFEPNAYLQILPSGDIVLQVDKLEMGQGVMTGFVTLIAEELDVQPTRIDARHAPVHALFQTPAQVTGESNSMRTRWETLRRTGALARRMLMDAAARRWGVQDADVSTQGDGTVLNNLTGAQLTYGELAEDAARIRKPSSVKLKSTDQFQYIGRAVPRPDVAAKVRGKTPYGIDTLRPGMMIAVIARAPRIGATVERFDARTAKGMPGVAAVLQVPTGIAVLASTFWHARAAAEKLEIDWRDPSAATADSATVQATQRHILDSQTGPESRHDGDVERAFAEAADVREAEYAFPFLAHATMEPMNATAHFRGDACEVWAPTQCPDLAREAVMKLTGLRRDQVQLHQVYAGGGFGRRYLSDFVAEAVTIAMRVDYPVKLIWSREDDMRHDFFRGACLHRVKAALSSEGDVTGWEHRLVTASLIRHIMPDGFSALLPERTPDGWVAKAAELTSRAVARWVGPVQAWEGSKTMPYAFDNIRVEMIDWDTGIPSGIWRSVGNHYNAFVVESFVDELATHAGVDPFALRRRYLADSPRHLAVMERLERESRWGAVGASRAQGVAVHACYDSVVGQVVEISIDPERNIKVHRVTCVIDCGVAINPDVVRQQMESGIVFGLTAALLGEIDIEGGRVHQSNFHDYQMLTLANTPEIAVHILSSENPPGGVGEAGVPAVAPAVANAVFAATGERLRQMPLRL